MGNSGKKIGRVVIYHLPCAEIRDEWNYTYTSPYAFIVQAETTLLILLRSCIGPLPLVPVGLSGIRSANGRVGVHPSLS